MANHNQYDKQALKFLEETGTEIIITKAVPQKALFWGKKTDKRGIDYWITIKNARGSYGFDFWDSIANKEEGKRPRPYDILACLSLDNSSDFNDFCSSYGYDNDSRIAEKTYKAVQEQDENLERIFSVKELDKLQEIQ